MPDKNNRDIEPIGDSFLEQHLCGSSPAMETLRAAVAQLNSTRNLDLVSQVLILGESGSGKNHLARVLAAHRRWVTVKDSDGDPGLDAGLDAYTDRFHEIHLPALPDQLIESELFGHKKGAFTDAVREKPGLLTGSGADDLLLDEIGDISAALQAKLLGVLETKRFRAVGGALNDEDTVNARLLMATNRPLAQLVAAGAFRADLYYRMHLFVLRVPALREQPENIGPIARRIEAEIRQGLPVSLDPQRITEPELSEADLSWARQDPWPGNVRELKHAIVRWFFHDGQCSLREVVQEMRSVLGVPIAQPAGSDLAAMVANRLSVARANGVHVAGTLNEFVASYADQIKGAVAAWYRSEKPSGDELLRLFPDHTNADSIRNKLSEWRAK